jgi:ribonuclease D
MIEDLYVDDDRTLSLVTKALEQSSIIALDTEFVRESTYYPKLCLIQVATEEVIACIDCLAAIDLTAFFAALLGNERTWLLHSARQDLEVLWLKTPQQAPRLIDTQLAAALLGFPPQIGLQDLLREVLDVELVKGHARTDWTRRPLPEAALRYAFDDVRFLPPLWQELERRLVARDRLAWLEEDCRAAVLEPIMADPLLLWGRLGGVHTLGLDQQCAAYALIRWREETAQRLDRPRRWIMPDAILLRIAKTLPRDMEVLRAVPDLPPRVIERHGKALLEAVCARNDPQLRASIAAAPRPAAPDKKAAARLNDQVKARASELGIASEVLATRRDIAELASGGTAARTGWRMRELAGLLN